METLADSSLNPVCCSQQARCFPGGRAGTARRSAPVRGVVSACGHTDPPRPCPMWTALPSPPRPPVLAPRITSAVRAALSRGNREKRVCSVLLKAFLADVLLTGSENSSHKPNHTSGALSCWTRGSVNSSPRIKQPLLCMVLETRCSEAFWSGSSDLPFTSLWRTCLLFHVNGSKVPRVSPCLFTGRHTSNCSQWRDHATS